MEVQIGTPVIDEDEAKVLLAELLSAAEKVALRKGKKGLTKEERASITAHFLISETYIGELSPQAVAGWFARNLKILPQKGGYIPFVLNDIQWRLLLEIVGDLRLGKPIRVVILKARQFGISTLIQALIWFLLLRNSGRNATVIAHKGDVTGNLYEMTRRFYKNMPFSPITSSFSRQGIVLAAPHDSRLTIESAEGDEPKRGFTIHYLHCSEPAFWPNPEITDLGLMQTVPDDGGSVVVKESTANGVGGLFYRQYWDAKEGRSSFKAIFLPWHLHSKYQEPLTIAGREALQAALVEEEKKGIERYQWTLEQIAWRRKTISDKCDGDVAKFHQEYPSNDREAFLVSGRPVFDLHLLEARSLVAQQRDPVFQGLLIYDGD